MTLVVAQETAGTILIVGDTQITDPKGSQGAWLGPRPKTRILGTQISVSFAGSPELAANAILDLEAKDLSPGEVVDRLLAFHRSHGQGVDFIVASVGEPRLVVIRDGVAAPDRSAWIGSVMGFRRYQGYRLGMIEPIGPIDGAVELDVQRLPSGAPEDSVLLRSMIRAMRLTAEDNAVPDVGGFAVPLGLVGSNYEYLDYVSVMTPPLALDLMPETFAVQFGTAQDGGHAANFMSDRSPLRGAALYFLQGRFGLALVPKGGLLSPEIHRDLDPIAFEEKLRTDYGMEVGTFFGQPEEHCTRALALLKEGDVEGALHQANLAVNRSEKSPAGFHCRGIIRAEQGELDAAVSDFSVAIRLDPQNRSLWDNRGICLAKLGRMEAAERDFEKSHALDPTYERAIRHLEMVRAGRDGSGQSRS